MDLQTYLKEIEYAARATLELVWAERRMAEVLGQEVAHLTQRVENEYNLAETIMQDALDADDFMLGVGRHWENYFGDDKERYHKDVAWKEAQVKVALHTFSAAELSGSVLQFGKQAISLVFGGPKVCPPGRLVGGVPLRDVIWQGRNQSNHWDDPKPKQPLIDCFEALAKNVNPSFGEYSKRNLAFDVLNLLGWKDFGAFKRDLESLT